MEFIINVAVPLSGDAFRESVDVLELLDCIYIPERKCWAGEFDADFFSEEVRVIGTFQTSSLATMTREQIVNAIDRCADFKAVGR